MKEIYRLSEQLARDDESGDFGEALNGYSDRAKILEDALGEIANSNAASSECATRCAQLAQDTICWADSHTSNDDDQPETCEIEGGRELDYYTPMFMDDGWWKVVRLMGNYHNLNTGAKHRKTWRYLLEKMPVTTLTGAVELTRKIIMNSAGQSVVCRRGGGINDLVPPSYGDDTVSRH